MTAIESRKVGWCQTYDSPWQPRPRRTNVARVHLVDADRRHRDDDGCERERVQEKYGRHADGCDEDAHERGTEQPSPELIVLAMPIALGNRPAPASS